MATIRRRLAAIEKRTSRVGVSDAALRVLVSLLARRDAIFFPWRTWGDFRGAVADLQEAYASGLRGVTAKADGREMWKLSHYARNELIEARLVESLTSGGQVTSLLLTLQGEADARALAGPQCLSVAAVYPVVMALREAILEGTERESTDWIRESELLSVPTHGDPSTWEHADEAMLPLIVAGTIRANCDRDGRVSYQFTGKEPPTEPESQYSESEELSSLYFQEFRRERQQLERLSCESYRVVIPRPVT